MTKRNILFIHFFIIILTILILLEQNKCVIYIPFKILETEIHNSSELIKYCKESKIYSELMIGSPPQKISVFFESNIYEINLFQNLCDIPNSFYNKEKSSSYNYIKNINYMYNRYIKCSIINETIYLFTDQSQKNKISISGINIVYTENKKGDFRKDNNNIINYEYHPNTCLKIGFLPKESISYGYFLNFVQQIKHSNINKNKTISKGYDWTFKFNSDKEGFLIIGEKPHEFDKNNYKEQFYILTGSKNRQFTSDWYIEFDSIYYSGIRESNNSLYNNSFNLDLSTRVNINYGLIEGTTNYENNIKKDFFDRLIKNKQCITEEINIYRIYSCEKKTSYNYIKEYFPTLKFCFKQHKMCFEFNYKDLFIEINDKLYFLVFFNNREDVYSYRFTLGQIFLKKYLITFNYDTKMIGFYNKRIEIVEENSHKNNERYYYEHDIKAIIVIIIAFIVFLFVGFLLGKKIYDRTRKKKANELIDDYEYSSQDINAQNNKNGFSLEMKSKIII